MSEFEALNAGNSEAQEKMWLSRLFAQSGTLAATGVLGGLVVTQAPTANGTVLIASGSAVVHPTMTVGASLLVNDTQKTLDIFTANPMGGLARRDIVVFDSLTASIIAIIGTPNASPTDPTVPNTAVALWRLRHDASATTIFTAHMDTLIVPTYLRGVVPPDPFAGTVRHYLVTTNASGDAIVTHNLGRVPVAVVVTPNSPITGVASTEFATAMTDTYTSTTFRVRCLHRDSSPVVGTNSAAFSAVLG
jgi:hypothetical protein